MKVALPPAVFPSAVLAVPLGWVLPLGSHGTELPRPSQGSGHHPTLPTGCCPTHGDGQPQGIEMSSPAGCALARPQVSRADLLSYMHPTRREGDGGEAGDRWAHSRAAGASPLCTDPPKQQEGGEAEPCPDKS